VPIPIALIARLPWLTTVVRWGLAWVFVAAGSPKFTDTEGTVRSVRAFRLMPESLVRPFAYALPALELVLAGLLVLGLATRLAALVTAALTVMFMFGIAMAWGRGLSIDCGCFGAVTGVPADPVAGYIRDLLRDAAFLAGALLLASRPVSRLSLDALLGITHPDRALGLVQTGSGDLP
jgi:uncharacterized membrane protein YphA (DoxX/SURF4 family)